MDKAVCCTIVFTWYLHYASFSWVWHGDNKTQQKQCGRISTFLKHGTCNPENTVHHGVFSGNGGWVQPESPYHTVSVVLLKETHPHFGRLVSRSVYDDYDTREDEKVRSKATHASTASKACHPFPQYKPFMLIFFSLLSESNYKIVLTKHSPQN